MKARVPVLPLLAGLILGLAALSAPPILWEWRNQAAGRSVALTGLPSINAGLLLIHPPSMAYLVGWSLALFGDHTWALRIPGLLALLATGALIWSTALELGCSAAAAWLASAIFLTNPLAIQGALGIDFADGSLLTLSAALVFWTLFRRSWGAGLRAAAVGAALCLCVWAKLATAFLIICAFGAAALLEKLEPEERRTRFAGLAVGGMLFVATWGGYCLRLAARTGAPVRAVLSEPFAYLTGANAASRAWEVGAEQWALYEFSFAAYAGFFLLAAGGLGLWSWARRAAGERRLPHGSLVPLFALACLGLYSVFLGGGRAYPKYFHTALLPLSLLAARWLADEDGSSRLEGRRLALAAALAAYYALVVGDYVFTLNFEIRKLQLLGNVRPAVLHLAAQLALYALPLAALAARVRVKPLLIVLLLSSQLGLDLIQALGGYNLRQAYGASDRDFLSVVEAVRAWPAPGPVVADTGVVYAAGQESARGFGSSSWKDLDEIAGFIEGQRPKAVVYGLPINTVGQLREIAADARLNGLLSAGYDLREIGPFSVWLRRIENKNLSRKGAGSPKAKPGNSAR